MNDRSPAPRRRAPSRAERAYVQGVFRLLFGLWLFGLGLTGLWFVVSLARLVGLIGGGIGVVDLVEPLQYAAILVLLGVAAWLARQGVRALFPRAFEPVRAKSEQEI